MNSQITHTKLDKLNTFELYKHHSALTSSLSLLTEESKELALAELEACAHLRSSKLDGIHYHITKHEKLIEVGQEEKKLLDAALKHHKAEICVHSNLSCQKLEEEVLLMETNLWEQIHLSCNSKCATNC